MQGTGAQQRTFDFRVGIGIPTRSNARTGAFEMDDWHRLSLVFARRGDLGDLNPHCDKPRCFLGVQGPSRSVRRNERIGAEVELVEFAIVEEADDTHPCPRDVVRVLCFERDGRVHGDIHLFRAIAMGVRAIEGNCPVWDGVFGEKIVSAGKVRHVVMEYDHDGFEFLPVDFLGAVGYVRAPEGGVVVFRVLSQVVDAGADVRVQWGGVVAEGVALAFCLDGSSIYFVDWDAIEAVNLCTEHLSLAFALVGLCDPFLTSFVLRAGR